MLYLLSHGLSLFASLLSVGFLSGFTTRGVQGVSNGAQGCRERPPRGAPWVSGLVGHFVQTWPDSECSHTVQFLDGAVLRL